MLTLLAGLFLAAVRLPMPLVVMQPGPTTDVSELLHIDSPSSKPGGSYLLTTALITSTEGVTVPGAIDALFDRDKDLVSRESIFPRDSSRLNTERIHAAQMAESQEQAAVAALHELGMRSAPEGAFVRQVEAGTPAARKLRPGDVIVAIEGQPVLDPPGLVKALAANRPGDTLSVSLRRDGKPHDLEVETVEDSQETEGGGKAKLGVAVIPKWKTPIAISIDDRDIGGPSAGLIFAVAIYDSLSAGDLARGRQIAATGAIINSEKDFGSVQPVGAVAEKVTAAGRKGVDVFLVPRANGEEARSAASAGLKVVAVSTLHDAIEALKR